ATPPGGDPTKDGVVINYDVFGTTGVLRSDFNKGRTATHEIAHWMGLNHIWGDDVCGDDGVDDTPRQKSYNFGCPSFPRVSNCSSDGNGDMYMNFLDLSNDACMNMFTQGQKIKMRTEFSLKGKRNSFLRSYKCDGSLATGGPMPQDSLPLTTIILPADIIKVFPNPVINTLNIQSTELVTLKGKTALVYTLQGKPVHSVVLTSNIAQIHIGHLQPGMYMLRIGDAEATTHFKIIKM
ncbi:MAG: zinc-dependent metalloprotease, partial [Ferruginibacter sp.]